MTERGVVLLTVPKGLADAIDHYAARYGLSSEQAIRMMATAFHMQHERGDAQVIAFARRVSEDAKRECESASVLIGKDI